MMCVAHFFAEQRWHCGGRRRRKSTPHLDNPYLMRREGLPVPWRPINYGRSSTTPPDRARNGGYSSPRDIDGQRSACASHRVAQDAVAISNNRGCKRHRPGYPDDDPYDFDGWMGAYSGGVSSRRQRLSPSRPYAVRLREARGSEEALREQQQQLQLAVRNEDVNDVVSVGCAGEAVVAHDRGQSVREDSHHQAALLDHHMDRIEQLREVCDIETLGQLVAEALTGSHGTTADAALGGPSLLLEGPAGANASSSVADLRPSDLLTSEQRATEGLANLRRPVCRKKLPTAPGAYWPSFFDEDTLRASSSARSEHSHVFSLPPPTPPRPAAAPPVPDTSTQQLLSNGRDVSGEERGRRGVEESKGDDGEVVLQLQLPKRGPPPEEVEEVGPATEEDDELTVPGAEGEHLDHEDDEDMARETPVMNVNGVVERILQVEAENYGGELRDHHAAEEEEEDQEAVGREEDEVPLGDYYYDEEDGEGGEEEDEEDEDGEYYGQDEGFGGQEGDADQPIELGSSSDEGESQAEELEAQEGYDDDAEAAAAAEEPQQSIAGPATPAVRPHGPPFAPGDAGSPAMAVIDDGHVGDYSDLVAHSDDDGQFDAQRVGIEDDDEYEYDDYDEEREEGSEGREGQPPLHSQQMRRGSTSQLAAEDDGEEVLARGALRQQRRVESDEDGDAGTVEGEEDNEDYVGEEEEEEEGEGSGSAEGEEDDYEVDAGKAVALSCEVMRHRQTEDIQIAEEPRGRVRGNAGRLGGPVSADVESERSDLDDGMEEDEDEEDDEEEEEDGNDVKEGAGVGHHDEDDGEEGHLYGGLEAAHDEQRLPDQAGQASPLYQGSDTETRESRRHSRHADRSGRAVPACGSLDAALGLDALQEQTNEDGEHDEDDTEGEEPGVTFPHSREEPDATLAAGHVETKAEVISEATAGPAAPPTSEDAKPSAGSADDAGATGSTTSATLAVTSPAVAATAVVETTVAGATAATTSATPAVTPPAAAADAVAETIVAGATDGTTSATPAVTPPAAAADAVAEATMAGASAATTSATLGVTPPAGAADAVVETIVAQNRSVLNVDVVPEDTGRQHGGQPEEHGSEEGRRVEETSPAPDRLDQEDNHPPATAEGSAHGVSAEAERPPEADRSGVGSPELERAQDRESSSSSSSDERRVSGDGGASGSDPEVERSEDAARQPPPEVQGAGGSSGEEVAPGAEESVEAVAEEERSEEGPAPGNQSAGSPPVQPEQEGVEAEEKEDERQEEDPDEADTQRSILQSVVAAAVAVAQEEGHKEVTVTVETTEEVEVVVAAEQDGGGGRRDDGDGNGAEKMEAEVGEGAPAADVEMEWGADDEVNDGMSTEDGDGLDAADADTMKTSDADDDDMMQMDDTAMS